MKNRKIKAKTETDPEAANLARGLSLLMMHEKCSYFSHMDQCYEYHHHWRTHPFGLQQPPADWRGSVKINFVGAHATDMSVEVFLAHIRFLAGYTEEARPTKLRVISCPFNATEKHKHYVYFEIWTSGQSVISGETTDCSGAGNAARQELEDVFAVLALTYGLTIDRVLLNRVIRTQDMYLAEEAVA